jgi:hypothetical protein
VKLSLAELRKRVQDEADAYVLLEDLRWGPEREGLTCPHCGNGKAYFLTPKGGSRGTQAVLGPDRDDLPWHEGVDR